MAQVKYPTPFVCFFFFLSVSYYFICFVLFYFILFFFLFFLFFLGSRIFYLGHVNLAILLKSHSTIFRALDKNAH